MLHRNATTWATTALELCASTGTLPASDQHARGRLCVRYSGRHDHDVSSLMVG
jgi:hypothetical protein